MKSKLGLDTGKVKEAKEMAARIIEPVQEYIAGHSTVTVERATLRLLGADDVDAEGVPVPNIIIDALGGKAASGAATWYVNALIQQEMSAEELNKAVGEGLDITALELADMGLIKARGTELAAETGDRIKAHAAHRQAKIEEFRANERKPLLYLIVATGNIHEDVKQATAAAEQGADVIAVIRSTVQSLLDYVPYGATTEGFGGTYATQENFRIMRAALDEVAEKEQRYIRLVNYASGLCMPEIAAMGALERLDMMLNDSMYGILFRDINMYRTFVDQHFSRMLNAFAGITINTGEDNYLTTSDAFEKAHTVLASQLINEQFALHAGLPAEQIGLGHAFEMDPDMRNGFLYEMAQAQMAREIFPDCPLKYMPPTKYMTGDIFKGYAMNAMFNFVSRATGQSIHLLGMLTEAVVTPFMQDRYLAVENARYVMENMADFDEEIVFKTDGLMAGRAREVLGITMDFLKHIEEIGLMEAIGEGLFADIKREKTAGKGFDGVVEKQPDYWNPVESLLAAELKETNHAG